MKREKESKKAKGGNEEGVLSPIMEKLRIRSGTGGEGKKGGQEKRGRKKKDLSETDREKDSRTLEQRVFISEGAPIKRKQFIIQAQQMILLRGGCYITRKKTYIVGVRKGPRSPIQTQS